MRKIVQEKRKQKHQKKPSDVICPYCGRRAVLRPAEYIYGNKNLVPGSRLYVCSNYPECSAYVGVHQGTLLPKGHLADGELRHLRILAHRSLDQLWKSGLMSRDEAYDWLARQLVLEPDEAHIGNFSNYYCNQTIEECERFLAACAYRDRTYEAA